MSEITYDQAFAELQQILQEIEQDASIDQLAERIKRSNYLVNYCKEKLRNVEAEVKSMMDKSSS